MPKSNKRQGEVILLSAHDLEEVNVILRNHVRSERCIRQSKAMARDFLGCSLDEFIPGFDL